MHRHLVLLSSLLLPRCATSAFIVFFSVPMSFTLSLYLFQLFARIAAICVPFVLYVVVWLSVDPPTIHIDNDETALDIAHAVCKSEHSFWGVAILGGEAVLLICGVFMAYLVRNPESLCTVLRLVFVRFLSIFFLSSSLHAPLTLPIYECPTFLLSVVHHTSCSIFQK